MRSGETVASATQTRINKQVEQALLRKATGYSYTQQDTYKLKNVEYNDAGKKVREVETVQVVAVEKHVPPEYSAIALWLKARAPDKWGDAAQDVPTVPVVIVDDIPAQRGECGTWVQAAGAAGEAAGGDLPDGAALAVPPDTAEQAVRNAR